jgi:uncharacterized delta-60 repeat protein
MLGCSGGNSNSTPQSPPPPQVAVSVSPSTATVVSGKQQQFTAAVSNTTNAAVTWQVSNVSGGNATVGTISSTGMYTAPASVPSPASVEVKAISQADTTKSGTSSVTVTAASTIHVSVSPATVTLGPGQTLSFNATVTGSSNSKVTWSVSNSALGSIDSNGLFTAPATIATAASVNIIATSQADNLTQGSATVSLISSAAISPTPNACATATAQSGCVDTTFGSGGFTITNTDGSTPALTDLEGARHIIQQSDGKLIAIGSSGPGNSLGTGQQLAVVRYNSNGILDTTFGTSGMSVLDYSTNEGSGAIDANGNILILGWSQVIRLKPNGALDVSWGSSGIVPLGSCGNTAIAIQADGKLVVAGQDKVCRFNSDGTVDNTFASAGLATITAASGSANGLNAVQVESVAGKDYILVGGQLGPNWSFGIVRLTSTGSMDSAFGTNGEVVLFPDVEAWVSSVVLDPTGNILVAAVVRGQGSFVLARLTSAGSLDTTFGDADAGSSAQTGTAIVSVSGADYANFSNGTLAFGTVSGATKIYYAFEAGPVSQLNFELARFDSSGRIDQTFGGIGVVAADFGGHFNAGNAIVVQSSGSIIEAGAVGMNSGPYIGYNFGLVRFWP